MSDIDERMNDTFVKKLGYHRHKPNYKGKGYYYRVGGYDITKEAAKAIQQLIDDAVREARIDQFNKTVELFNIPGMRISPKIFGQALKSNLEKEQDRLNNLKGNK